MIFINFSSNNRTSVVKWNVIYSAIIRLLNILISLILVPLTINYVTSEIYGIWLSLSSIVTWISFLDIGFGLGLRNKLTMALAFRKYRYGKILVSTTYFFMIIIFTIVCVLATIGCSYVNWSFVLNISPEYTKEVTISFQIVIIAFCVRMILQLIANVCQAYQKTAMASFIDLMGNIIALLFVLMMIGSVAPNLIYLSSALCLAPLLAFFFANILLYKCKFQEVTPSIKFVRHFVLRDITSLGVKFFLIQIICVILYQTTNFIISHFCGPEQVTVYNIAYKYLNVAIMAFTIIQAPVWSAFSDAYALKDYDWMRRTYRRLLQIIIMTELGIVAMVLVSPVVYELWIGESVIIPFKVTVLLAIYTGILLINNLHAMIINGIGKIKLQTLTAWTQGLVFIPTVYMFASTLKLEGILIALILITIIPTYFLTKQVFLQVNNLAKGIYNQ